MHSLDRDILETELKLKALENDDMLDNSPPCDPSNIRVLHNKYNASLHWNSLKSAQRAKMLWVQKGNLNNSFFHNNTKIHKHKSLISHNTEAQGCVDTNRSNIEWRFLEFYSKL